MSIAARSMDAFLMGVSNSMSSVSSAIYLVSHILNVPGGPVVSNILWLVISELCRTHGLQNRFCNVWSAQVSFALHIVYLGRSALRLWIQVFCDPKNSQNCQMLMSHYLLSKCYVLYCALLLCSFSSCIVFRCFVLFFHCIVHCTLSTEAVGML